MLIKYQKFYNLRLKPGFQPYLRSNLCVRVKQGYFKVEKLVLNVDEKNK